MSGLRAPREDFDVQIDAHLRALPSNAKVKGLFPADVVRRVQAAQPSVDLCAKAGTSTKKFRGFKDYPYADLIKVVVEGARILYPKDPQAMAIRKLGRSAYDAFTSTQFGRVLFGVVGKDFERVASLGVKAYKTSVNFGTIDWKVTGVRIGEYVYRDFPGLIETYQLGIIEGGMVATGATGVVEVEMHDLGDGRIQIRWD